MKIHTHSFADLSAFEVYGICRLRQQVFILEQDCPYPDLDGLDVAPTTEHMFIGEGADILACLRILVEPSTPDERRIGRVVTHPEVRGQGLASALMLAAVQHCSGRPVSLSAQAHLEQWYGRFGFRRIGADFLEDSIPHTPMRLG